MDLLISEELIPKLKYDAHKLLVAIEALGEQLKRTSADDELIISIDNMLRDLEQKIENILGSVHDNNLKHSFRNRMVGFMSTVENIVEFAFDQPSISLNLIEKAKVKWPEFLDVKGLGVIQ